MVWIIFASLSILVTTNFNLPSSTNIEEPTLTSLIMLYPSLVALTLKWLESPITSLTV